MVAFSKNFGKIGIEWRITCPNGLVGFSEGKCFLGVDFRLGSFSFLVSPSSSFFVFLVLPLLKSVVIIGVYRFGWVVYLNSI